ncbi:hypothetical protein D7Y13_04045 [Corallococcus praedator]|uniref:Uncharacterized protein n=1 Tax=Corallococcus praedator TaxID=2316724 RepID=A0ABX9QPG2_9BACT|nr:MULTISPECIES: hypothetical protein [Corallococcus]RKH16608.1 hypothetical protein D7X74_14950 [Corallococcus sp. CA047B]RKH34435.1 hypothetical protein D7X75_08285 [Corallococcus sp. CA031C]RKI15512.1 hypothetical protein D7Y13_04045 [Corallococcus praedator]
MRKVKDPGVALMNDREMKLVLASAPRNLMELSERELKGMVKRARGMMDKYTQRSHMLRREASGKRVPTRSRKAEGDMNTRRKAALFRTALSRFEMQLGRMERAAMRKARPAMRKARPAMRKRPVARKATRATPLRKKTAMAKRTARPAGYARRGQVKGGARKAQGFSSMKTQAHRASQGRRTQARRDATR